MRTQDFRFYGNDDKRKFRSLYDFINTYTTREIHVDKSRRGRTAKSVWRWMKRRAAIEPGIGHLKQEHRMDRNRLKGIAGDWINAILSAA